MSKRIDQNKIAAQDSLIQTITEQVIAKQLDHACSSTHALLEQVANSTHLPSTLAKLLQSLSETVWLRDSINITGLLIIDEAYRHLAKTDVFQNDTFPVIQDGFIHLLSQKESTNIPIENLRSAFSMALLFASELLKNSFRNDNANILNKNKLMLGKLSSAINTRTEDYIVNRCIIQILTTAFLERERIEFPEFITNNISENSRSMPVIITEFLLPFAEESFRITADSSVSNWLLKPILTQYPYSIPVLKLLQEVSYTTGNLEKSREYMTSLQMLLPNDTSIQFKAALLYFKSGNHIVADIMFREILKKKNSTVVAIHRIECLLILQNYSQAWHTLSSLNWDEVNREILQPIEELLRRDLPRMLAEDTEGIAPEVLSCLNDRLSQPEWLIKLHIKHLVNVGSFQQAKALQLSYMESLRESKATSNEPYLRLAAMYAQQNNPKYATDILEQGLAILPTDTLLWRKRLILESQENPQNIAMLLLNSLPYKSANKATQIKLVHVLISVVNANILETLQELDPKLFDSFDNLIFFTHFALETTGDLTIGEKLLGQAQVKLQQLNKNAGKAYHYYRVLTFVNRFWLPIQTKLQQLDNKYYSVLWAFTKDFRTKKQIRPKWLKKKYYSWITKLIKRAWSKKPTKPKWLKKKYYSWITRSTKYAWHAKKVRHQQPSPKAWKAYYYLEIKLCQALLAAKQGQKYQAVNILLEILKDPNVVFQQLAKIKKITDIINDEQLAARVLNIVKERFSEKKNVALARLLVDMGQTNLGLEVLAQAMQAPKQEVAASKQLAHYLRFLGHYQEAELILKTLLFYSPEEPKLYLELAEVYLEKGQIDEALQHARTARFYAYDDNEIFSVAEFAALFYQNRISEAWHLYQNKSINTQLNQGDLTAKYVKNYSEWCQAKSRLLVAVSGIGDEIRWASIYPKLSTNQNDCIAVTCDPRLLTIFQRSFPQLEFVPCARRYPAVTHTIGPEYSNVPHSKLTFLFDNTGWSAVSKHDSMTLTHNILPDIFSNREAFQREGPLLQPDLNLVEKWKTKFVSNGRPNIGITWRSDLMSYARAFHYLPFPVLLQLIETYEANWYVLQSALSKDEKAALEKVKLGSITFLNDEFDIVNDFENLAGALMAMDHVIASTTSTFELAAALGIPISLISRSWIVNWRRTDQDLDIWFSKVLHCFAHYTDDPTGEKLVNKLIESLPKPGAFLNNPSSVANKVAALLP